MLINTDLKVRLCSDVALIKILVTYKTETTIYYVFFFAYACAHDLVLGLNLVIRLLLQSRDTYGGGSSFMWVLRGK